MKKAKLLSDKKARQLAHEERVHRKKVGREGLEAFEVPPDVDTIPSWDSLPGDCGMHDGEAALFSDLLLHDMGRSLADPMPAMPELKFFESQRTFNDQGYFGAGSFTIIELAISSTPIGSRRQALGFLEPLIKDFSATLARVLSLMP